MGFLIPAQKLLHANAHEENSLQNFNQFNSINDFFVILYGVSCDNKTLQKVQINK